MRYAASLMLSPTLTLAAALALAAPLADQSAKTTPPAAQASPAEQAKTSSAEKTVTASGCLGGGPAGYTLSTAIAAGAPHDEAEAHGRSVGTTGATLSYTLTARDGVDLRELVGKKVEVRGVLQAETPAARPSKAADSGAPDVKQDDSPEAGRPAARAAKEAVVSPTIAVTSVQLLSATCQ